MTFKGAAYLVGAAAACALVAGPPASAQTVGYSTPLFSATFCGSQVTMKNTTTETATETQYSAYTPTTTCLVEVRTVGHEIAVDYSSSDFYLNNGDSSWARTSDIARGYQDGHVYSQADFTSADHSRIARERFIIVSPTEVIEAETVASSGVPIDSVWDGFAGSLSVK